MLNIPDHPAIRHAETYGYGEPEYNAVYECPCCGTDLEPEDGVFMDTDGEIIGCAYCFDEDEWDASQIEKCEAEDVYG